MPNISAYGAHRTVVTARGELVGSLARLPGKLPENTRVHLGLFAELPDRVDLIRHGLVNLHNVPPGRDAFECLRRGDDLYLLGSTPRGVLHAVYALDDRLAFGPDTPPDWHAHGVFRIAQRHFHPRFSGWPGERADIRFLSRLGASHCLISHDWQGSRRSLQGYVTSPIFPEAVPAAEVARNNAGLHRLITDCQDYGLELALWITELPCQGGPWVPAEQRQAWLEHFPAEVLSDSGTYQGKVLCFAHAQVQAFYRDLLQRFFTEFPEIETLYLFGMDSGGEGCDPKTCPRCGGMSKFEQRDRLIRFLCEEGTKVRPGLRVLTTGWHWESHPGEFLKRQARLPAASGVYLAAESDGWQAERQNHDFLRQVRRVCREQGQLFIGYDDLHLGDDATHLWGLDLQDFPLGIGAKISRWHDLEVDGVFDHWGTYSEMLPSNSVACREFFLNPLADPEAVCRRIALNQYGPTTGDVAFRAWQALERAHRILSNCATWAPAQWPGWYAGRGKAVLPDTLPSNTGRDSGALVAKGALGFAYNGGDLADCLEGVAQGWRLAAPHYAEAARLLGEAIAAADDTPAGYAHWWNGATKPLSKREHLRRHRIYAEFLGLVGREIGLHFELHALLERCNHDVNAYVAAATPLLEEDLAACRDIVAFVDRLVDAYPQAASMSAGRWRADYARKIDQLEGEWKPSVTGAGNRLSNPSFEDGNGAAARSWSGTQNAGAARFERSDEQACSGRWSARMVCQEGDVYARWVQRRGAIFSGVKQGDRMRLTFRYRATADLGDALVQVNMTEAPGWRQYTLDPLKATDGQWIEYQADFTVDVVPNGSGEVQLRGTTDRTGDQIVVFDDVSLERFDPEPSQDRGAATENLE